MTDETQDALELLSFADTTAFESWLAVYHNTRPGVWLKIAKKDSGARSISASEALDVALCFGWIDSQRKSLDESHFIQKYTPRRPKSAWSKVNTERVEALMAAGRMRDAGLSQVAIAKADGRWDAAYQSQREATTPPDLEAALASRSAARSAFDALGRSDRYALILRLLKARSAEERTAQLNRLVAALEGARRQA